MREVGDVVELWANSSAKGVGVMEGYVDRSVMKLVDQETARFEEDDGEGEKASLRYFEAVDVCVVHELRKEEEPLGIKLKRSTDG